MSVGSGQWTDWSHWEDLRRRRRCGKRRRSRSSGTAVSGEKGKGGGKGKITEEVSWRGESKPGRTSCFCLASVASAVISNLGFGINKP